MNNKLLKTIILFFLISSSSFFCFAQNSNKTRSEKLQNSLFAIKLNASYTNEFPLYNMNQFSKSAIGVTIGYDFSLLPDFSKNLDVGFYGRVAFHNFIPYSFQLEKLYSYCFSDGIFMEYYLPQDFSIYFSLGGGFLISDISFVSAQQGSINDIYYDFALESDLCLRKGVLNLKKSALGFFTGCHFAFYNEKTEFFCTVGPSFGLLLNFTPKNASSNGIKR